MCAKHYENPTMLSRVTAKNVGDVFLRHTVVSDYYKLQVTKAKARSLRQGWRAGVSAICINADILVCRLSQSFYRLTVGPIYDVAGSN